MARITVEDCVLKVPNRFELVMKAAQRARNISAGLPLTVERDNDKNPVIALREIADETVSLDELEDSLVKSLQKHVEIDEPEEEELDLIALQQEIGGAADDAPARDAESAVDELQEAEELREDDLVVVAGAEGESEEAAEAGEKEAEESP
jgi:DNA-directed RNA polymerase subunit omega